eukprot:16434452-Heterocapsa_arctica.AAC.1
MKGKCDYHTCYHQGTRLWDGTKLCARHMGTAPPERPDQGEVHPPRTPRSSSQDPGRREEGIWET